MKSHERSKEPPNDYKSNCIIKLVIFLHMMIPYINLLLIKLVYICLLNIKQNINNVFDILSLI